MRDGDGVNVKLTPWGGKDRGDRTAMDLPRRVDKPWGYELWYALTDRYAGKILHVDRGHRLSLQFHERKDESNYLLKGRLRLTRGDDAETLSTVDLGPGDAWRNPAGLIHTIEAL